MELDAHRQRVARSQAESKARAVGDAGRHRDLYGITQARGARAIAEMAAFGPRFAAPAAVRTRGANGNIERQHEAMDRLARYAWPGNVRELQNVIERAVILSRGSILELEPDLVPMPTSGVSPQAAGEPPACRGAILRLEEADGPLPVPAEGG